MAEYELNDEAIELIVLIHRIFSDTNAIRSPDIAYLVGETEDNQDPVLFKGVQMIRNNQVWRLGMSDGPTGHGYPGFSVWKNELLHFSSIKNAMILPIPYFEGEQFNTYTEAKAFARYAKDEGWECAFITAAPFHQVRAFITFVSVALVEYPALRLYSVPGMAVNWGSFVRHSQGVQMGKRIDLLRDEMKKLYRYYHETKSLACVREILAYLDERDG